MKLVLLCILLYSNLVLAGECSVPPCYTTEGEEITHSPCKQNKDKIQQRLGANISLERCTCSLDNPTALDQCAARKCNVYCKGEISAKVHGCTNTKNQETKRICQTKCNNVVFNNSQSFRINDIITQLKPACTKENKDTLIAECKNSRPSQLICPGGDSTNHNCDHHCQQITNSAQITNALHQCINTTTQNGFKACQENLAAQIKLPQSASELSENKGFAWQSCTMGADCEHRIQAAFDSALQECQNIKTQSLVCCGNDLSQCAVSSTGRELATATTSSITSLCQQIKKDSSNINNLVQKVSYQCQTGALSCVQSCDTKIKNTVYPLFLETCSYDLEHDSSYERSRHTCSEDLINKYTGLFAGKLSPILSECQSANSQSQQQAQATTKELIKSILSAGRCTQQASGGTSLFASPFGDSGQTGDNANIANNNSPNPTNKNSPSVKKNKKRSGGWVATYSGSGGNNRFNRDSRTSFRSSSDTFEDSAAESSQARKSADSGAAGKALSQNGTPTTSSGNPANADSKKQANKKPDPLSDKQKDKTKNKEKLGNNNLLTGSVKTANNRQPQSIHNNKVSWDQIKHSNIRIDAFGSPHSNIFKRISDRIFSLCKTDKLDCSH